MKSTISIFVLISIVLFSCNQDNPKPRNVRVLFSNGIVYCEGNHVYSSDKGDTIRIGIWKFYYPDGQLESEREYDKDGKGIRYNGYSEKGVLLDSYALKDNLEIYSEFYDSGILKRETIVQTNSIDEDNTEQIEYVKEFYSNGHPMEEYQRIDGELEGAVKKWDLSGNLVLETNYRKGLIQQ